jgi:alpha-glucosidase
LPEGDWIEQPTGRHIHGGERSDRKFFLEQIPVYTRPGAIIPMQPPMLHTATGKVDPLIVHVVPLQDHQQTSYTVYEDSSEGRAYMAGQCARTTLSASRAENVVTIQVSAVQGSYPGMLMRRRIQVELPGDWPPAKVEVNGKPLPYDRVAGVSGWRFDGNTLSTIILTDEFATNASTTIAVTRNPEWVKNAEALDGFAGKMTSLRHAYDAVNGLWTIDDLTAAMQRGNRIGYHPENAALEIQRLSQLLQNSHAALAALEAADTASVAGSAVSSVSDATAERARIRAQRLSIANSAVEEALRAGPE